MILLMLTAEQNPTRRRTISLIPIALKIPVSRVNERFYEKVIKVKADVAALRNLFSDVSIDVRW